MIVTWLVFDELTQTASGYYSPIASLRYRLAIPLRSLEDMGHRVRVVQVHPDADPETVASRLGGDALIVAKVNYPAGDAFRKLSALVMKLVEAAQRDGRRVIVDVCDDLFSVPVYGEFLRALVVRADSVVASSAQMAEVVHARTSRGSWIAEDPFEGPRGIARFEPPGPRPRGLLGRLLGPVLPGRTRARALKLLWFGHGSNFAAAVDFIPQLERLVGRYSLGLHFITSIESGAPKLCASFNERHAPLCELRFTPWSLAAMQHGLADCDLVIIPTRLSDTTKLVKSSNRLVQSLWSGRFVLAHPISSYRKFEAYSWLGADLVEGIEWALRNPREVRRRIAAGQEYIETHHAPETIARQWDAAITATHAEPVPPA